MSFDGPSRHKSTGIWRDDAALLDHLHCRRTSLPASRHRTRAADSSVGRFGQDHTLIGALAHDKDA